MFLPAVSKSAATWIANSRVGTMTKPCGLPAFLNSAHCGFVGVITWVSNGIPNPKVLPVPVFACPIRSWPAIASGKVIS
ncbi:unannotated protein [freshwater metagenome]|uniref:Unannotated protein n=1 Tax=freshwater metagenome TaxID=449393 RepID=A0A6J7BR07_9ZZZZ